MDNGLRALLGTGPVSDRGVPISALRSTLTRGVFNDFLKRKDVIARLNLVIGLWIRKGLRSWCRPILHP